MTNPTFTSLALGISIALAACERTPRAEAPRQASALPDEPSPPFRNVGNGTAYVGDSACAACHATETSGYRQHAMAQSFHPWTASSRVETALAASLFDPKTGFNYSIVDSAGALYQVESLTGQGGNRIHELRRRIDYVMGSGTVARTYFTSENGRLFQLPLTWYRDHGWDFSPGYQVDNPRFDRSLPDRCIACHSSYPKVLPHLEGKYAEARPGIGCERCHGPGALHAKERTAGPKADSAYDQTIVNPARLPLARRLDVCEQCHVHTTVSVLRERKTAFSFEPSQALRDQWAFFKVAGGIDIVSHADRLRQSACFLATQSSAKPLECATCHNAHAPPLDARARNGVCQTCHAPDKLQASVAASARPSHAPAADCVSCHMPKVGERGIPHGTFTDHWIRVVAERSAPNATPAGRRSGGPRIEPYYDRDRSGPEAPVYDAMGGIVYATLANDGRELARSAATLGQVAGSDTTRGDALFLLGVAYQQLGKTDDALRTLEQAVRADSSEPERLRALAQAYQRAGRSPALIEPLYKRALALQPALAWIRADYGNFLQAQGRRDDAMAAYRSAVAEQPSLSVAWFDLGTVLVEAGRRDESSDAFRQAVSLDPSLGQALSPLFEVSFQGDSLVGAQSLGSPLQSLAVRDRGPRAAQIAATMEGQAGFRFFNLPPRSVVQVMRPDGSLVRTLPVTEGLSVVWDGRTDSGGVIGGGLYRAMITPRAAIGRASAPQRFSFGVVRRPSA